MDENKMEDLTNKNENLTTEEQWMETGKLSRKPGGKTEARQGKTIKIFTIVAVIIAVILAGTLVVFKVVIPNSNYRKAIAFMEAGEYEAAVSILDSLTNYRDSDELINQCYYSMYFKGTKFMDIDTAIQFLQTSPGLESTLSFKLSDLYRAKNCSGVYTFEGRYGTYTLNILFYIENEKIVARIAYDNWPGNFLNPGLVSIPNNNHEKFVIDIEMKSAYGGDIMSMCFEVDEIEAIATFPSGTSDYLTKSFLQ